MTRSHDTGLQATPTLGFGTTLWSSLVPVTLLHVAACLAGIVLAAIAIQLYVYNYQHAWVSSHFAVMARTFNVVGLFDLGLVPVQNNVPLTTSPDAYLHWPPLYPVLLALLFRVFGEGVVVHHLSSVAINVASAALIWRSLRSSKIAAGLGALTFLGAPIMFRFGFAGLHLHLAIMLTILALVLFAANTGAAARSVDARRRRVLLGGGALAYFLATMTSWEPLLAAPAFCFFALRDRHRQTTWALALFGLAAVLALLAIALLYGMEYPHFAERLWNRAVMRSGMASAVYPPDFTPHDLQDIALANSTYPWTQYIWEEILPRLAGLGIPGLVGLVGGLACMQTPAAFPRPAIAIYLGWLSIFCLWSIVMRNHMGLHEYQMLILLPAAASGAGLCAMRFLSQQRGSEASLRREEPSLLAYPSTNSSRRNALVCFAAPAMVVLSSYLTVRDLVADFTPNPEIVALANLSRQTLPDNAIIATPYSDMVFVYYSGRHVIRAVTSEDVLFREQTAIQALCAKCPVYLVADRRAIDAFPSYKSIRPLAGTSETGAVWRVEENLGRSPGAAGQTPPVR